MTDVSLRAAPASVRSALSASSSGDDSRDGGVGAISISGENEFVLEQMRSLSGCLSDPLTFYFLERYSEQAFDAENIHFIKACREYFAQLKQPSLVMSQLIAGATHLFDEFIDEGAPQQINVSATQKAFVLRSITEMRFQALESVSQQCTLSQQMASGNTLSTAPKGKIVRFKEGNNASSAATSMERTSDSPPPSVSLAVGAPSSVAHRVAVSAPQRPKTLHTIPASQSLRMNARRCFYPLLKEVYHLLHCNTYARFLNSPHAQRAEQMLLWIENFTEFAVSEQAVVMAKLKHLFANSARAEADYTSIRTGAQRGRGGGGGGGRRISDLHKEEDMFDDETIKADIFATPAARIPRAATADAGEQLKERERDKDKEREQERERERQRETGRELERSIVSSPPSLPSSTSLLPPRLPSPQPQREGPERSESPA